MKRFGKMCIGLAMAVLLCVCLTGCSMLDTIGDAVGLNLTGYTDALLGSVAYPNGTSAADFKAFVGGVMLDLGVDKAVNSVDIEKGIEDALKALNVEITEENSEQIKDAIRGVLEENGVDTTDMDIDIEGIINSLAEANNTETEAVTNEEDTEKAG